MEILQAGMKNFNGVMRLLRANHADTLSEAEKADGFVTTNFTPEQMERLITKENGVTIAREDETVLAFAMAAPWEYWAEWPLFTHMIEKLPGFTFAGQKLSTKNSYQYGPMCVEKSLRGTGLFERVFNASLASMENRFPIMATFVNQVNARSYAAHSRKAKMETAGTFDFNGRQYYLMACLTRRS